MSPGIIDRIKKDRDKSRKEIDQLFEDAFDKIEKMGNIISELQTEHKKLKKLYNSIGIK